MLQVPYPLNEEEKVHFLKRIFASRKTSKTRDYFQGWLLITTLKTILIYRKNTVEAPHSSSKVHFEGEDMLIKDGKASILIYSVPEAREIIEILSFKKEGYERLIDSYLRRGYISSARALLKKAPKEIQNTETFAKKLAEVTLISFTSPGQEILNKIESDKELFTARSYAVRRRYSNLEEVVYFLKSPEAHIYWAMASYGVMLSSQKSMEKGFRRSSSTERVARKIFWRTIKKALKHFEKFQLVEKFLMTDFVNTELKNELPQKFILRLARKLQKQENPYLRAAAAGMLLRNGMKEKAEELLSELLQEDLEEELFMKCVELLRGARS